MRRNDIVRSTPSEAAWPLYVPEAAPAATASRIDRATVVLPRSCTIEWIAGQRAMTPSCASRNAMTPCAPRSMAANLSMKYCKGIVA